MPYAMRHILFLLLFVTLTFDLQSQENKVLSDSIERASYIIDQTKRFNIKLEVSNDISKYKVIEDDQEIFLSSNLAIRYALVLSYKWLSVRIGVRPKISASEKEEKGDSDTFQLRVQALFDNWSHTLEYRSTRGFYVSNTNDLITSQSQRKIQFPGLTNHVFTGSSLYKLNKNFSIRATQSQTEIQKKSSGSFMPGIGYNYYDLVGSQKVRNENGDLIYRDHYQEYHGLSISAQIGYYHTFVYKQYWFASVYAIPSAGYEYYRSRLYTPEEVTNRYYNELFLSVLYGGGAGFNGDKLFFGFQFNNRLTNEKFHSGKALFLPRQNLLAVYLGYRFKPPKTVTVPIDTIEEKVPLLKN